MTLILMAEMKWRMTLTWNGNRNAMHVLRGRSGASRVLTWLADKVMCRNCKCTNGFNAPTRHARRLLS